MATFDMNQIRSFYGSASAVWYAPAGTARPAGLDTPPSGYVLLGALSSKGVGETRSIDTEKETIWQGATAFESISSATIKFDGEAMEHSRETFQLLNNNAKITTTNGVSEQVVTVGDAPVTNEFIIDAFDGKIQRRILFTGQCSMDGESRMEAGKATVYPFTVTVNGGTYTVRTNDPAWT